MSGKGAFPSLQSEAPVVKSEPWDRPKARLPFGRRAAAALLAALVGAGLFTPWGVEAQGASTTQQSSFQFGFASMSAVWDARDRPAAGCPGGCAYVFGGFNNQGALRHIVQYNPTQNTVTTLPAGLPGDRYLTSAAWDGRYAYIFGGYNPQQGALSDIIAFDPDSRSAAVLGAKLPEGRYYTSAVWTGLHVYVFGGRNIDFGNGEILRYDPRADSLAVVENSLPSVRIGASAVWAGDAAYIFGGHDGNTYLDTIAKYDPEPGTAGESDIMNARLPGGRAYTAATWDGRFAYIFGGSTGNFRLSEVLRYDPARDTLVTLATNQLPSALSETAAVTDGNVSYVLGGDDGSQFSAGILKVQPPTVPTTSQSPGGTVTPGPTIPPTGSPTTNPRPTQNGGPGSPEDAFPLSQPAMLVAAAATLVALPLGYLALRAVRNRQRPVVASRFRSIGAPASAAELAGAPSAPVLSAREVSVLLGKRVAVRSVTLDVPRASLTFLLGMSGSGKSSLLRALVGLNPFQGEIQIEGVPLRPGRPEAKRLVGYVPQELQLYENLNPLDNIAYFASQYGIPGGRAQQLGTALLADLGLAEAARQRLSRLSGGQRRRVSIAAALVHEPPLVVLDEPTSGLDFSSRKALWSVLQRLARDRGIAVLASTHFIDDTQYADRVGIMFDARLVALGTPRELIRSLPGGGRCVEIEFEDLSEADRARLEKFLSSLRSRGLVERAEYHAFSVRYFCKDPANAARVLPDELFRQRFAVRSTRLDDVNLEDVFVYYTGRNFDEAKA